MLGKIFGSAVSDTVWLGNNAYGSKELFQPWPETQDAGEPDLIYRLDKTLVRRSTLSRAETKRRADIWNAFLIRRYWGRTWIVQEVFQAKSVHAQCGPDMMLW